MKRFWLGFLAICLLGALSSCSATRILMQQAPKKPSTERLSLPEIHPREISFNLLQTNIYGQIPILSDARIEEEKTIAHNAFTNGDIVREWRVSAGFGARNRVFHVVLLSKIDNKGAPYIIIQNFCPNNAAIPIKGVTAPDGAYFDCSQDGVLGAIFSYFFGRYITVSPYQMILNRGYNIAVVYPPEFLADSQQDAPLIKRQLFPESQNMTGNLAIWASLTVWLAETLKLSEETSSIIAYGHSRYGKTALLAAASSNFVDAAIAHQSGTGGASILRDQTGESIEEIIENYPHWFTQKFTDFSSDPNSLPVDAHNLLSLISPKPLMLGNARRDVWSDPEGAFEAAIAATPAWEQFELTGLSATRLDEFIPSDNIAFWMRPGTHGVVKEDWPAFLRFLDAHFKE